MHNSIGIIGAGPSGIAAAIQLHRSGHKSVIFEKSNIGGLLNNANLVENYPGFPKGISGKKLALLMKNQLESFSPKIIFDEVKKVSFSEKFEIETKKQLFNFEFLVVACGTKPKQLISDEYANIQDKIYYDIRDLINISEKKITIIGAGDAAFDYGLSLSSNKNQVTIINRGSKPKCLELLFSRAKANSAIRYLENYKVIKTSIEEDELLLYCKSLNDERLIKSDIVIGAIGRIPDTDFIPEQFLKHKDDLIKEKKLYFVGDVINGIYRQAAISVGDGLKAAMEIDNEIRKK